VVHKQKLRKQQEDLVESLNIKWSVRWIHVHELKINLFLFQILDSSYSLILQQHSIQSSHFHTMERYLHINYHVNVVNTTTLTVVYLVYSSWVARIS